LLLLSGFIFVLLPGARGAGAFCHTDISLRIANRLRTVAAAARIAAGRFQICAWDARDGLPAEGLAKHLRDVVHASAGELVAAGAGLVARDLERCNRASGRTVSNEKRAGIGLLRCEAAEQSCCERTPSSNGKHCSSS
jgi:hypothetical protein